MKKRWALLFGLVLTVVFQNAWPAGAAETVRDTQTLHHAVYLGVQQYGKLSASPKDNFQHEFWINGTKTSYLVANTGNYTLQNRLEEGGVFTLTVTDHRITDIAAETPTASGTVTAASSSYVTIDGTAYPYAVVYSVQNNSAGHTTVNVSNTVLHQTGRLYGDTLYLMYLPSSYTAPVHGTPGVRTLKNLLQTAMEPVGTTLYIYGGGWDWQDVHSSNQTMTLGLPQSWVTFFQQQTADYTYKDTNYPENSYYPFGAWNQYYYAGADCSGYLGWVLYNTLYNINQTTAQNTGEVCASTSMAGNLAARGLGTLSRTVTPNSFRPGDIFSMNGHVWMCIGKCQDGSIVFVHSTPSESKTGKAGGGVQLSALNPNGGQNCDAYRLAQQYMNTYYPAWSARYTPVLKSYTQYTKISEKNAKSGLFHWNLSGTLTDPDGYINKSAEEILSDLFQPRRTLTPEQAIRAGELTSHMIALLQ